MRTARHQRHASDRRRERLDDEARLAIWIRVQHERRARRRGDRAAASTPPPSVPKARQLPLVVRPAALHLDPHLEKHACRRTCAPCRRRACDAIAFIRAPPSPSRIARWLALSTYTVAWMRRSRAVERELVDCHGRRIRNFVAELAKDLLAHELGREETLVAIGDVVGRIERRRQEAAARRSPPSAHRAACRAPRRPARWPRSRAVRAISASERQQRATCRRRRSILLTATTTGTLAGTSAMTARSAAVRRARVDDPDGGVHIARALSRTVRFSRSFSGERWRV